MKKVHVLGGGTFSHVTTHLALCAPAFGSTALDIATLSASKMENMDVYCHLTKMADPHDMFGDQPFELITNDDVKSLVDTWIEDPDTKIIFFNAAMCDFTGNILDSDQTPCKSGKYEGRLKTSAGPQLMLITPAEKILVSVRKERKDIFLVAFKTTSNATEHEQYLAGLKLLKDTDCSLVLANDVVTRNNIIITPDEICHHPTTDRGTSIMELVDMTYNLSKTEVHEEAKL